MSPKPGYSPPPLITETRYTFDDVQKMFGFAKQFLAEEPLLRYAIVAAGLGAIVETIHIAWLALRYIFKF
jgi:hypothetical protein